MTTYIDPRKRHAFHTNKDADDHELTPEARENLLKSYLPEPASESTSPDRNGPQRPLKLARKKPVRAAIKKQLYLLVFTITHFIFSISFRFRRAYHAVTQRVFALYYYHHRTPEYIKRDIKPLDKLPQHLSVILDLNERDDDHGNSGLEGLVHDVCEITAWTVSAGIPMLSIYEETGQNSVTPTHLRRLLILKLGILKNYMPQLHEAITQTFVSYFGEDRKPTLTLRAPLIPAFSPPETPPLDDSRPSSPNSPGPLRITLLLLSRTDGRDTIVDLTKTLADMAQKKTIGPKDITTDLINMELKDAVSGDPDLLILFSPRVVLKGYPPWQVRLTEI
jgi:dehydrodolichyl diphosphate syntase complex subunit NUS1